MIEYSFGTFGSLLLTAFAFIGVVDTIIDIYHWIG